jgi:hypothetical protein
MPHNLKGGRHFAGCGGLYTFALGFAGELNRMELNAGSVSVAPSECPARGDGEVVWLCVRRVTSVA